MNTYGKIWKSMFEGSLYGKGAVVQALMAYSIACADKNDLLELNSSLLANTIGCDKKEVDAAIEFLTSPDENSRSKEEGGRRLIHRDGFTYFVVNRKFYSSATSDDDYRRNCRIRQRRRRYRLWCEENGEKFSEEKFQFKDRDSFPQDWKK